MSGARCLTGDGRNTLRTVLLCHDAYASADDRLPRAPFQLLFFLFFFFLFTTSRHAKWEDDFACPFFSGPVECGAPPTTTTPTRLPYDSFFFWGIGGASQRGADLTTQADEWRCGGKNVTSRSSDARRSWDGLDIGARSGKGGGGGEDGGTFSFLTITSTSTTSCGKRPTFAYNE